MPPPVRLTEALEDRFWRGIQHAARFFMGDADGQKALEKLVRTLDELGIPYAIIEAMALNAFGYRRVTVDVDVLLTTEGLASLRAATLGRGYVERVFLNGCQIIDTPSHVYVEAPCGN